MGSILALIITILAILTLLSRITSHTVNIHLAFIFVVSIMLFKLNLPYIGILNWAIFSSTTLYIKLMSLNQMNLFETHKPFKNNIIYNYLIMLILSVSIGTVGLIIFNHAEAIKIRLNSVSYIDIAAKEKIYCFLLIQVLVLLISFIFISSSKNKKGAL